MYSEKSVSYSGGKKAFPYSGNLLALLFGLLVFISTFAYLPSLNAPFVFDDIYQIVENDDIHLTRLTWEELSRTASKITAQRPLAGISFTLNYYFNGLSPFFYHVVNLCIHILTGFFVLLLMVTTLSLSGEESEYQRSRFISENRHTAIYIIAFCGVLIWMLSPLQTNAVTYIIQRMASLAAMFYVLSMLLYVRGRLKLRQNRGKIAALYFVGCLLCMVCAFTSKEISATLPFAILLYEWFFLQNLRSIPLKWAVGGILIGLAFTGWISYMFLGSKPLKFILFLYDQYGFTPKQRILTELRVIGYYLSLIIFPNPERLNLDHDYPLSNSLLTPETTIISAIMLLSVGVAAVYTAKKHRLLSFCLLWFLGNLVIESSIIGIEIIYEHRLYLPSVMLYLGIVYLLYRLVGNRWLFGSIMVVFALFFCSWTYQRNQVWADNVALWTDTAQKSPEKARPWQNLAFSYAQNKKYAQAAKYYQTSLEIEPDSVTFFKRGSALSKIGHHVSAAEAFNEAMKMGYDQNGIQSQLAYEYAAMGEFRKALENYRQAVEKHPEDEIARQNLRALVNYLKQCRSPFACVKQSIERNPHNPALFFKLGTIYEAQGKLTEAIEAYEKAFSMTTAPKADQKLHLFAVERLSTLYTRSGQVEKAIDLYWKAVALAPENPYFYYQLAALNSLKENLQKSISCLEKAIENGFNDFKSLLLDPRFHSLRSTPEFQDILIQLKNTG